jgi:hypothetical protein
MRYITHKAIIFLFLFGFFFACQQEIDDYFHKDTDASVDTDILSLLKQNEDYSQFINLLEQYRVDSLLSAGKIYTFFVPNNSAMDNMEQGILGESKLIEYLMTESYINIRQISTQRKIETNSGKFAIIEASGDAGFTFDGIPIVKGSPLTNNGRYYEIVQVAQPRPNLYEYIAATNEFYRAYIDLQDSTFLDRLLSTPIGYTDDGRNIYDTVLTTINLFEYHYFPVSKEFRDNKATMFLFTQEQYDKALGIISNEIDIPVENIPNSWQNEVLMPYLIKQSVFRNVLPFSTFLTGRARNIVGDSVDVNPMNISPEYFDGSNGRAYNFIDFQVPEHLYKVYDTVPMGSLVFDIGSGLWGWVAGVVETGQKFNLLRLPQPNAIFGNTLLINMGNNFRGDFSFAYKHKNVFPATYKLTLRANVSRTGVYNIFVNGKQYPIDIGNGPRFDFDFFDLRSGVISSVTNMFYPFANNFCKFDILVDNITEYGDVEVKLKYVGPSPRNTSNSGLNIDFISLEYFQVNN